MEKIQTVVFGLGRIGMLYGLEKKRIQPASHIEAIKSNKNRPTKETTFLISGFTMYPSK